MNFFEYLFCRHYWWFTEMIKEKEVPIFYSISGLTMFQTCNIIPLYGIFIVVILQTYKPIDILGINPFLIIWVVSFIMNLIYFRKAKYTGGTLDCSLILEACFIQEDIGTWLNDAFSTGPMSETTQTIRWRERITW